jgi:hypothetical protein
MKTLLLISLMLTMGSYSFAYKLNSSTMEFAPADPTYAPKIDMEGRVDLTNSSAITSLNGGGQNTFVNGTAFVFNAMRPRIIGKATDELSYVLRLNLGKANTAVARDNTTDLIDQAWGDYKPMQGLNIRVGKQNFLQVTGWESVYYLTDVFTYSSTFNKNAQTYGYYRSGVAATYNWGDHNFTLAATNAAKNNTEATGSSQLNNGLAYSFYYDGQFLDGMIKPILAYTMYQMDGNADVAPAIQTNSTNDTLIAVGVRIAPIEGLTVDVDYDNLNQPNQNSLTQANNQLTTTIRGEARYQFGQFIPFVNYISDKSTAFGTIAAPNAGNFTLNTYDVGVMYYPFKDKNFRYHVVYSNSNQNNDSSAVNSQVVTTNIRAGIKFDL